MPKISVIVPVYKVESYLRRCVDSILAQTFTDFELILVDDGSPDNSGIICDEYALRDSRIYVIHQENGGLSAARNAGIDWVCANSDSEWISFIDSDDWVHPRYFEALLIAAQKTGLPIAICGYEQTAGNAPEVDEAALFPKVWSTEKFYCEHYINATVAWGKLYKTGYWKQLRYPLGKINEDEYITYRYIFQFKDVAVIDQPLYAYYQNNNSIMHNIQGLRIMDVLPALRMQLAYFKQNGFNRAYVNQVEIYALRLTMSHNALMEMPSKRLQRWKLLFDLKKLLVGNYKNYPIKGHEEEYKKAFPVLLELYYKIKQAKIK